MEGFPLKRPEAENNRKEMLRDAIFSQLVASKVLNTFHEELEDLDLSDEAIDDIVAAFSALPEDSKKAVLAIPAQLRPGLFEKYAERVNAGEMTGADVVSDLLAKSSKYGYSLGFHLSPREIKPAKDGSWVIKGTEPDHRHDDIPMAYYSKDYAHRYLKKPVQWLYVIRAETAENSGHYQDNNGAWGHAPSLSVVDAIDLQALEREMDEQIKRLEEKSKTGDAASAPPVVTPSSSSEAQAA